LIIFSEHASFYLLRFVFIQIFKQHSHFCFRCWLSSNLLSSLCPPGGCCDSVGLCRKSRPSCRSYLNLVHSSSETWWKGSFSPSLVAANCCSRFPPPSPCSKSFAEIFYPPDFFLLNVWQASPLLPKSQRMAINSMGTLCPFWISGTRAPKHFASCSGSRLRLASREWSFSFGIIVVCRHPRSIYSRFQCFPAQEAGCSASRRRPVLSSCRRRFAFSYYLGRNLFTFIVDFSSL